MNDDTDPSEPAFAKNKQRQAQEVVGHGTHVAGIVNLVAPEVRIMPLRVLDREGYSTTFHVAGAITYAADNRANVINLSLGTPSCSRLIREKVDKAIGDGVIVVAAAGNYSIAQPQYPASNGPPPLWFAAEGDGLLAVTSVNAAEKKSDFANYGTWVDIAAPGEEILSYRVSASPTLDTERCPRGPRHSFSSPRGRSSGRRAGDHGRYPGEGPWLWHPAPSLPRHVSRG